MMSPRRKQALILKILQFFSYFNFYDLQYYSFFLKTPTIFVIKHIVTQKYVILHKNNSKTKLGRNTLMQGYGLILILLKRTFYSSTAACAAARRCWVSVTYRVSVKYWHLFLDSFCSFCLIFQGKNGSMADSFSFLDFIFIMFYTRLLDFSLTIVNCKCFVSPEDWTSWTNTTF